MVSSSKFWVQTQIELSMYQMCCLSFRMILSVQEDLDQPVIGNIHSIKSGAASSETSIVLELAAIDLAHS